MSPADVLREFWEGIETQEKDECDRLAGEILPTLDQDLLTFPQTNRDQLGPARDSYNQKYTPGNYAEATQELKRLGGLLEAAKQNRAAKRFFDSKKAKATTAIQTYDRHLWDPNAEALPVCSFGSLAQNYKKHKLKMAQAEPAEDYGAANAAAQFLGTVGTLYDKCVGDFDKRWQPLQEATDRLDKGIQSGFYGDLGEPLTQYTQAKNDAAQKVKQARTSKSASEYAVADAALDVLEAAVPVFRKAAAASLGALGGDDKQARATARARIQQGFQHDPDLLKELAEDPNGAKLLDNAVLDLTSTQDAAGTKFVEGAIAARFGLELKGDWGKKSLPRLYKLLKMVPEKHVKNPDWKIERHAAYKKGTEASYYDAENKVAVLNLPRNFTTGPQTLIADFASSFLHPDTKMFPGQGPRKVSHFDHVTLHEIGHAVDPDTFGGIAGWQEPSVADVADVAGNEKGFYDKWEGDPYKYPRPFLKSYLIKALQGGQAHAEAAAKTDKDELLADPAILDAVGKQPKDETEQKKMAADAMKKTRLTDKQKKAVALKAVLKILDGDTKEEAVEAVTTGEPVPPTVDWKGLAAHQAVAWCEAVRLKGSAGLWRGGESDAKKFSPDKKRVYQEAYEGHWVSYNLDARSAGVSNYQFRAPGEWFADAYAAYFLGKLPNDHPVARWLVTEAEAHPPV